MTLKCTFCLTRAEGYQLSVNVLILITALEKPGLKDRQPNTAECAVPHPLLATLGTNRTAYSIWRGVCQEGAPSGKATKEGPQYRTPSVKLMKRTHTHTHTHRTTPPPPHTHTLIQTHTQTHTPTHTYTVHTQLIQKQSCNRPNITTKYSNLSLSRGEPRPVHTGSQRFT